MIRYGFFNSVNGDRKYNADDMTKYFDKIVSNGVFRDPANALRVTSSLSEGLTIDIQPGRGLINCRWLESDTVHTITLDPSDMLLDRIDTVVMRLDLRESERKMEIDVVKGVPAVAPVPHQRVNTSDIKELILGYVRVNHNVITISDTDITDTRADGAVCGWVHSLVSTGNIRSISITQDLKKKQTILFRSFLNTQHPVRLMCISTECCLLKMLNILPKEQASLYRLISLTELQKETQLHASF